MLLIRSASPSQRRSFLQSAGAPRTFAAGAFAALLLVLIASFGVPNAQAATQPQLQAPSLSRIGATTVRVTPVAPSTTLKPDIYEVFVRRAGAAVPNFPAEWIIALPDMEPADLFAAVTALQANTAYEVAVRGEDYRDNTWPLSAWKPLTTSAPCGCALPAPNVRITKLEAGSTSDPGAATLAWDLPAQPERVLRYELKYGDFLFDSFDPEYRLGGLDPAIEHTVTVTAVDIDGVRSPATTVRFRTSDNVCNPPVPKLQNLRVSALQGDRVTLAWDPLPTATGGDPCTQPRPIAELALSGPGITVPAVAATSTGTTITGLQPASRYEITIQPIPVSGAVDPEQAGTVALTTPGSFAAAGTLVVSRLTRNPLPLTASVSLATSGTSTTVSDVQLTGGRTRLLSVSTIPLTADIAVQQAQPATGIVGDDLTLDLGVKLRISAAYLFGAIPVSGLGSCQSRRVSNVRLTAAGPLTGGTDWQLEGAFTTSDLTGCGAINSVVSPIINGTSNFIALRRG